VDPVASLGLVGLTRRLVDIDSTTGLEAACGRVLAGQARAQVGAERVPWHTDLHLHELVDALGDRLARVLAGARGLLESLLLVPLDDRLDVPRQLLLPATFLIPQGFVGDTFTGEGGGQHVVVLGHLLDLLPLVLDRERVGPCRVTLP